MTRLNAVDFIRLQVGLEYGLDSQERLVPYNGSSEQAWFVVYRHQSGFLRFFRHDLPADQYRQLESLAPKIAFQDPARVWMVLRPGQEPPVTTIYASGTLTRKPDSDAHPLVHWVRGCWVVDAAGEAVAWGWSERQNEFCAELAVEVSKPYRRRGYGRQVAAAWANGVMSDGFVPFYSFNMKNKASEALARSLGVEIFAQCVAFE